MPEKKQAMAFDFDGTLIQNGLLNQDKGVHIIFASWYACLHTNLKQYCTGPLGTRVDEMVQAYIRYPGAPRFQQFSAVVNMLVNQRPEAVASASDFGDDQAEAYGEARGIYNRVYSGLNEAAANRYWKPYASIKSLLQTWSGMYDLYIASGVTQDLLEKDFENHGFDRNCFVSIQGGNAEGGNDKGQILTSILRKGYEDVLFAADSNKDLEYAQTADVKFYRIRSDEDYQQLAQMLPGPFPNQQQMWGFDDYEIDFFKQKATSLIRDFADLDELPYETMTGIVNKQD